MQSQDTENQKQTPVTRKTIQERIHATISMLAYPYKEYARNNLVDYHIDENEQEDVTHDEDMDEMDLISTEKEDVLLTLEDCYKADQYLINNHLKSEEKEKEFVQKIAQIWDNFLEKKLWCSKDDDFYVDQIINEDRLEKIELISIRRTRPSLFTLNIARDAHKLLHDMEIEQSLKDGFDKNGQLILI